MHRRRFLYTAAIGGASGPLLASTALAHPQATPEATPVQQEHLSLADRVAQIEPQREDLSTEFILSAAKDRGQATEGRLLNAPRIAMTDAVGAFKRTPTKCLSRL